MGGGATAPPAQPDPNILAERERLKAIAISQMYAQRAGYMGTDSTQLGGDSHTILSDFGQGKSLADIRAEGDAAIYKIKHSPVRYKTERIEGQQAFNDYNMLMAYRAAKRKGLPLDGGTATKRPGGSVGVGTGDGASIVGPYGGTAPVQSLPTPRIPKKVFTPGSSA